MFDHLGFRVRNLAAARTFYDAVARSLGLTIIDNTPASFLLAQSVEHSVPFVWIGTDEPAFWLPDHTVSRSPIHLAFKARNREAVSAFHVAGLEHGGIDNGAPGPRGPVEMHYYAAFVLDPDGNNIEAGYRGG